MSAAAAAAAPASECSVAHDESSPSELLSKTDDTGLVVRDRAAVVVAVEERSRHVFLAAGVSLAREARFLESGTADGDMVALALRGARARLFMGEAIGTRKVLERESSSSRNRSSGHNRATERDDCGFVFFDRVRRARCLLLQQKM